MLTLLRNCFDEHFVLKIFKLHKLNFNLIQIVSNDILYIVLQIATLVQITCSK